MGTYASEADPNSGHGWLTRLYDAGTGSLLGTLLSLPPAGEANDWLVLSPAGYAAGSEALLKQGRWRMASWS